MWPLYQPIRTLEILKYCEISWDFSKKYFHLKSNAVYNSSAKKQGLIWKFTGNNTTMWLIGIKKCNTFCFLDICCSARNFFLWLQLSCNVVHLKHWSRNRSVTLWRERIYIIYHSKNGQIRTKGFPVSPEKSPEEFIGVSLNGAGIYWIQGNW